MTFEFLKSEDQKLQDQSMVSKLDWKTPEQTYIPNYKPTLDATPDAFVNHSNDPSVWESLGKGFSNSAGSDIAALVNQGAQTFALHDNNYNPLQDPNFLSQTEEFKSKYAEDLADLPNANWTSGWIQHIKRIESDNEAIAANPISGTIGALIGAATNPTTYIGGIGLIKDAGLAAKTFEASLQYGGIAALQTQLAKETNPTISEGNVAEAAVFGAIVGGLTTPLANFATTKGVFNDVVKMVKGGEDTPNIPVPDYLEETQKASVGAMANPQAMTHDLIAHDNAVFVADNVAGSIFKALDAVGSKFLPSKYLTSLDSGYAKYLGTRLGGQSQVTNKVIEGNASTSYLGTEMFIKTKNHYNSVAKPVMEQYNTYRKAGGNLSENAWNEEVRSSLAGVSNNADPTIVKAASIQRKMFDNVWDRGVEEGAFTAPKHLTDLQTNADKSIFGGVAKNREDWLSLIRKDHSATQSVDAPGYIAPEDRFELIEQQKQLDKIETDLGRKVTVNDLDNPARMIKKPKNYIPHSYDQNKIIDNRAEFRKVIANHLYEADKAGAVSADVLAERTGANEYGSTGADLSGYYEAADSLIDKILLKEKAPFENPVINFKDKNLVIRTLNLKNNEALPFLKDHNMNVIHRYIQDFETQSSLVKEFGPGNIKQNITDKIGADYKELKDRVNPESPDYNDNIQALIEQQKKAVETSHSLVDLLTNTYNKDSGKLGMISRVLSHYNYLRLMGRNILAQIPDMARVLGERTLIPLFKDIQQPMNNLTNSFTKLSREDLQNIGVIMDDMVDFGRSSSINDIYQAPTGTAGKFETALSNATKWYGKVTLVEHLNQFSRTLTGNHVVNRLLKSTQRLLDGKLEKGSLELLELNRFGIDNKNAGNIIDQFNKHSTQADTLLGKVRMANVSAWDSSVKLDFMARVRNYIDRIVVEPNPGDKPFWVQKDFGKMIGQFKGFTFASYSKGLLGNIQDLSINAGYTPAVLTKVVAGCLTGYVSYASSAALMGRKIDTDPKRVFVEGFNRGGVFPIMDFGSNVLDQFGVGLGGAMGLANAGKFHQQGLLVPFLGPTASLLDGLPVLGQAMHKAATGNMSSKDLKAIMKNLPFQNHLLIQNQFTPLGDN